jgi:hypothetical protein
MPLVWLALHRADANVGMHMDSPPRLLRPPAQSYLRLRHLLENRWRGERKYLFSQPPRSNLMQIPITRDSWWHEMLFQSHSIILQAGSKLLRRIVYSQSGASPRLPIYVRMNFGSYFNFVLLKSFYLAKCLLRVLRNRAQKTNRKALLHPSFLIPKLHECNSSYLHSLTPLLPGYNYHVLLSLFRLFIYLPIFLMGFFSTFFLICCCTPTPCA